MRRTRTQPSLLEVIPSAQISCWTISTSQTKERWHIDSSYSSLLTCGVECTSFYEAKGIDGFVRFLSNYEDLRSAAPSQARVSGQKETITMISSEHSKSDKEAVYSWLREFNHEQNGEFMRSLEEGANLEFFLVARNLSDEIVGGLEGVTQHLWLRINLMAVAPASRSQGIGTELVRAAEKMALEKGCRHAYVDTMSYQAVGFYERLGFVETGRLENWDSQGHDKFFFVKEL